MPYMSVNAIDAAIDHIAGTYPAVCQVIALPEPSIEGRTIRAVKVAQGTGARTGILFLGGTHARELVNPETVVSFALRLCDAYTNNAGLTFGPRSYTAPTIQMVVNALDIFLVPMVNPDGRHLCLTSDPWWRKNRSNHPGLPCRGVDLNRNYDFLWSSGIGTSSDSCSQVFKGPSAFSEPETRNIRWMVDNFPGLACLVDIHSYMELILYPWGDDENQTVDPSQNFQNPAFDGQRGAVGSGYREYIPPGDLQAYVTMGERVRDGIAAVRGRVYAVQQSIALYPTTGTTHDYANSRYFVDTGRRRILGFTVETAREFQPADAEKDSVITEVSAGLMEFLLETLCPAEVIQALLDAIFPLQAMRRFRDGRMLTSVAGVRYQRMFRTHALELVRLAQTSKVAREAGEEILRIAAKFFTKRGDLSARRIARRDIEQVERALRAVRREAGRKLKADIDIALEETRSVEGKTLSATFKSLSGESPGAKRKSSAAKGRAKRSQRGKTGKKSV